MTNATGQLSALHRPCPAAISLLKGAQYLMPRDGLEHITNRLRPKLENSRRDKSTQKRLEHIATTALRTHAVQAFKKAGAFAAAAAVDQEPDLKRAANLASDFAENLYQQADQRRDGPARANLLHFANTAKYAANAALCLYHDQEHETLMAAHQAAKAIYHHHKPAGHGFSQEIENLVAHTLAIR